MVTKRENANKKGVTQSSDVTKATKDAYAKQRESRAVVSVLGAPAPTMFSGKGVERRRVNPVTGKHGTFKEFQKFFGKNFGDQWTLAGEIANAADAAAKAAAVEAASAAEAEAAVADSAAEAQAAAAATAAAAARDDAELARLWERLKGLQDTLNGGSKNGRLPGKIKNLKTEIRLIIEARIAEIHTMLGEPDSIPQSRVRNDPLEEELLRLNGELIDIAEADQSCSQPATANSTTKHLEEAQGILARDAAKVAICHKPTEAASATGGGKLSPEQIIQLTDELTHFHVKLVNGGSLTPGDKKKMAFLEKKLEAPTPWRD
jgi:hypothetical protein